MPSKHIRNRISSRILQKASDVYRSEGNIDSIFCFESINNIENEGIKHFLIYLAFLHLFKRISIFGKKLESNEIQLDCAGSIPDEFCQESF